jgi:hypothetical protein
MDNSFYIMLLRLLIDEFDCHGSYPYIPSWEQIMQLLMHGRGRYLSRIRRPIVMNMREPESKSEVCLNLLL